MADRERETVDNGRVSLPGCPGLVCCLPSSPCWGSKGGDETPLSAPVRHGRRGQLANHREAPGDIQGPRGLKRAPEARNNVLPFSQAKIRGTTHASYRCDNRVCECGLNSRMSAMIRGPGFASFRDCEPGRNRTRTEITSKQQQLMVARQPKALWRSSQIALGDQVNPKQQRQEG